MRRVLLILLAIVVGLPLLLIAAVLIGANVGPGRALIEREAASLSGGTVVLSGLAGRFPDALRLGRLELRDADGVYATVDNLALDWSPTALLSRTAAIQRLSADRVNLLRLPVAAPEPQPAKPAATGGFSLPVKVVVRQIAIPHIDLGAAVAGKPVALALDGSLALASLQQGDADLTARSLGDGGSYHIAGRVDPAHLQARVTAQEPAHGLISGLAGLPDLGAIALDAALDGPRDAVGSKLTLTAGQLSAHASGTVDLVHDAADLAVEAQAPAMAPGPALSWQSIDLAAKVRGPFTRPAATGTLRVARLQAGGAAVGSIAADLQGDAGAAHLQAVVEGLRLPGPKPDLLAAAPLKLTADARLDAADRPVAFTLAHPLIAAQGTAKTAGDLSVAATLHLPDLAPLAAIGGIDLRGRSDLDVNVAMHGPTTQATVDGTVGITGGTTPLPGLLGDAAKLGVTAALTGSDIAVSRLRLDGRTLALGTQGGLRGGRLDLDWQVALADLKVLAATVGGTLQANGHVAGPTDDLALTADLTGDVAVQGMPRGPLHAHVAAQHLPAAPAATITADGTLAGAPLTLAANGARAADGSLHVEIAKADWKSGHAAGALTLPPGATLPLGKLDLRMTRLDDLRPFLGQPLSGGVTASLETQEKAGRPVAAIRVEAHDAGLAGTGSVRAAHLAATVADPAGTPAISDGVLTVDGFAAGGVTGSARLTVAGPQDALAARLNATAQNVAGADARVDSAAVLDATGKSLRIASLTADWKGQDIRLLAPVKIGFANGVTIDRLRAGLGQATIEVAGRASPTLDLTAQARNITPDLVKPFAPAVDAQGTLRADARLTGTPARPTGTVRVDATGLRMRTGPAAGLPPANLTATADLAGATARLDTRLTAGRSTSLTVTGTVPIDPSRALALQAAGQVDLAMLDPILTPDGRRARGQLTLDASVTGTVAAPRLGGTARLANGEVQDFGQGIRLAGIAAELALQGDTLRLVSLTARAGQGSITASGTVGVLTPDQAVDIVVVARNARPIAGERLIVDLDADLSLRGALARRLALGGKVNVRHAEIIIPDKLPPSVAVLHVRRPGEKPAPPPAPGPEIDLDLTVAAERQIFVRGRGLFAEMEGSLRLQGTSTNPKPLGGFKMRQGTFSVAGQTLTFSKGEVSFNGGSLTDPSLDFVASSTNGSVTANLNVGGTASAPKITLTSTPELPQDEVLAYLLFKRSSASLSPFELAEIGLALASLTGTGPDVGSPLEDLRKGLGLDRLSVGSGANGAAALQAGRYVSPGVFVGAKQGLGGSSTQGLVQIDIAKGLKLEGTVGTGSSTTTGATPADSGGSGVGLTYQFEY